MIQSILLVAIALTTGLAQPGPESVTRLGEARRLDNRDLAQIVELGTVEGRRPWVVTLSQSSQVPPERWHVNAYLEPDLRTDGIRRGTVVDLEAINDGTRTWRVASRDAATWAQVSGARCEATHDMSASTTCRPFIIRGLFATEEVRQIVELVRASPRVPSNQDPTLMGYGDGPITGLWRLGPAEADVWLGDSLPIIASVQRESAGWQVSRLRLAGVR
jgi:hypothetical protein